MPTSPSVRLPTDLPCRVSLADYLVKRSHSKFSADIKSIGREQYDAATQEIIDAIHTELDAMSIEATNGRLRALALEQEHFKGAKTP